MKLPSIDARARLSTTWVNYNCGVRMVARLTLERAAGAESSANYSKVMGYDQKEQLTILFKNNPKLKQELITEFIDHISTQGGVPELKENNPVFPLDNGRYVPTAILVADDIVKTKADPWYEWAGLVRELQSNFKTYGVEVIPGPLFQNRTYSQGPHISRIWTLILPSSRPFFLHNRATPMWPIASHLRTYGYTKESISEPDWADLVPYLPREAAA